MTTLTENGRWRLTDIPVQSVFSKLPQMGKLMVILQSNGMTFERIGTVEAVETADDLITLSGAHHDAQINPARIEKILFDTNTVLKNKTYPRLECLDGHGDAVLSIFGWEGAEPFAMALAGVTRVADETENTLFERSEPEEVQNDLGQLFLQSLCGAGTEVELHAEKDGLRQSWRGVIESVKPSRGFTNVMTPDFHLHLKDGSIARWDDINGTYHALAADGTRLGLSVIPS